MNILQRFISQDLIENRLFLTFCAEQNHLPNRASVLLSTV